MLRILSLLPAATEIVYLLNLQKYLVGVSHECDYPPEVRNKLKVTSSEISNSMSSKEIDNKIKKIGHRGPGVFHIKEGLLKKLKPNLILTQELCEVCAVGFNQVKKAARVLEGNVKIVSLEPESVEDMLENIRTIGEFVGKKKEAVRLVRELKERLKKIKRKIATLPSVARNDSGMKVLVIEWLNPIMVAGHWVPQMVELSGGKNLISKRGEISKIVTIDQIKSSKPDILIISPCGFDIQRTIKEIALIKNIIRVVGEARIYLLDGNSYMTRPGPRIVDGIEILSEIIHPEIFPKKHTRKDWDILNI